MILKRLPEEVGRHEFRLHACSKRMPSHPPAQARRDAPFLKQPAGRENQEAYPSHPPTPTCQSSSLPTGYVEWFDRLRTKLESVFSRRLWSFEHDGVEIGFGHRMRESELPRSEPDVFLAGQLLEPDRPLRMQARAAESDVCAESVTVSRVQAR